MELAMSKPAYELAKLGRGFRRNADGTVKIVRFQSRLRSV